MPYRVWQRVLLSTSVLDRSARNFSTETHSRLVAKWQMAQLARSWWRLAETLCLGSRQGSCSHMFPSPVYSSAISFPFFALSVGIFERGRKQNHIESSKHETGLPVFLSVFLSFFNHTVLVVLCQVRKALDSEFGQAVAVANLVRPQWFSSLQSWQAVDHKLRFSGAHYCNRKIHSCDAWTYKTIVKTCKNRQKCQTAHYTLILVGWKSMKPFGSRKWQRPLCLQSRYPKWWSG